VKPIMPGSGDSAYPQARKLLEHKWRVSLTERIELHECRSQNVILAKSLPSTRSGTGIHFRTISYSNVFMKTATVINGIER
jgi:hypothetical protein